MNETAVAARPQANTAQPDLGADFAAIKARQQGAWSSGDYAVVGTTLQIVGEQLCEAIDLRAGQKVLDVAAGNGNVALAAARRWCDVIATDYVPALLDRARERAAAERLQIDFREADAEALPFTDGSFDVVVSTFGVMFTPDQQQAADELMRVCKPGGKIGLANWTPDGFIGQLFKTIGKHLPPPAGVKSPALWGTPARIDELFGSSASAIEAEPQQLRVPVSLAAALAGCLQDLLRPSAEGVCRSAASGSGSAAERSDRADRAIQPVGRWVDGRSQRIPRARHYAKALTHPLRRRSMRNMLATLSATLAFCTIAAPVALAQSTSHAGMANDHMMATPDEFRVGRYSFAAARRQARRHRRSAQSGGADHFSIETSRELPDPGALASGH